MRIFLLEDENMLRISIVEYLEEMGYEVESSSDGFDAKEKIIKGRYDLLLLDINTPKVDGFTVLNSIKKMDIKTPVIFISALTGIEDITKGFSLGCLDYLKKPFHLKELVLRIERAFSSIKEQETIKLTKNYAYDTKTKTLYWGDSCEIITKKQVQIIDLLSKNIGIVVDFERLREIVWDSEPIDNATIRAEINRLKKSLREDFIKNCRGIGYMVSKP